MVKEKQVPVGKQFPVGNYQRSKDMIAEALRNLQSNLHIYSLIQWICGPSYLETKTAC